MKKILVFSVVALLIISMTSVTGYARVGRSRVGVPFTDSVVIENDDSAGQGHVHVTTSPALLHEIVLNVEATSTYLQLFDSAGMAATTTISEYISELGKHGNYGSNLSSDNIFRVMKADLSAATAGQALVITFDPPIFFENGIFAGFADNTTCLLYTSPSPRD